MAIGIRPYCINDEDALFEAARESIQDVFPWLSWCHPEYRISDAREWIARQVASFATGSEFAFVIFSEEHEFLGGCGLGRLNLIDRSANLGYWVRTSATGRGVAAAAARLVIAWAFSNTEMERIEIVASLKNERSQRVAEKAGAVREGIARSRLLLHDQFHDAAIYSIIRSSGSAT
jgi:ribosomal-protein-serine acetyltransferase